MPIQTMKIPLPIAFFVLASSLFIAAQNNRSMHDREQTSFGVEDEFQRPVPLTAAPLNAIRETPDPDGILKLCAEEEGFEVREIPPAWFVASEVRLTSLPRSGLVVRGENACLLGAHITQFWVLEKQPTGAYKVVFTGRADALDVLPTRLNGHRDLQLVFVTQAGAYVDYVRLRYSNGTYHKSGHRLTHPK
jgi:hypothetical protein